MKALGASGSNSPGKVGHVQLLGTDERVSWKQMPDGLRVELPKGYRPSTDFAAALKVSIS